MEQTVDQMIEKMKEVAGKIEDVRRECERPETKDANP